ncbi:MAG: cytochrome b/b6 domain-containing protein, partial [Rhodospirillales bacterium]|nr:cytochrome b/b6 domain-containing protein [Rhodospirillales bacterium]
MRHDPTTIWLHWATALLVVLLWVIGQTIDFAPRGALRTDYRSVHIVAGITLAVVLITRIAWRLSRGGMLPPLDTGPLLLVARVTHLALYALMVATVGLGLFNIWVRGDTLFGLVTLPAFEPGNTALRRTIGGWHELAANVLLIVAGLLVAAYV